MSVDLRRLELADLDAVEPIERASYPAPWSRAMFATELAKPSSLSLAARSTRTGELVGYLILSRYVDAWHVMNVAVAPERRRRGIASALLRAAARARRSDDAAARLHARGAGLERGRDRPLRALRLPLERPPARLLHRQPRGRDHHVARRGLR